MPEISVRHIGKRTRASAFAPKSKVISTSKALAAKLAEQATRIRDHVNRVLRNGHRKAPVRDLFEAYRDTLIHDLTHDRFADMFAQTIAYGLFSSRCSCGTFAENPEDMIPETNLFSKELISAFFPIAGRKEKNESEELGIGDVADMLRDADMDAVLRDFGDKNPSEDPIIHFFEDFLKQYDAPQKMKRGVFYTPHPVVSFIVRSVHEMLREDFGLEMGLADTTTWGKMAERNKEIRIPEGVSADAAFVRILDPATGTGTFLVEVIDLICRTSKSKWENEGKNPAEIRRLWNEYVPKHLLTRVYGFELMMAPYLIAYVKIASKLTETGYRFGIDDVIRIHLTNSLEPAKDISPNYSETAFAYALAHEARAANQAKRNVPFTVVIGNPPYSVSSSNKNRWIRNLIFDYKKDLNERKTNLDDDYIKFLRYGQYATDKSGKHILAYISNNSFVDGITHRQMRKYLSESFDRIRILDLHGNAKKKEVCPDGSKDQNVFDIMQGVSICFFVKSGKKNEICQVCHSDLQGTREYKFDALNENSSSSIAWNNIDCEAPYFFFVPKNFANMRKYDSFFGMETIFVSKGPGCKTERDKLTIAMTRDELEEILSDFLTLDADDIRTKYSLSDSRDWKVAWAKKDVMENYEKNMIRPYLYRPFDYRYVYYSGISKGFVGTPGYRIFSNMLHENIGIVFPRMCKGKGGFRHGFVSERIADVAIGDAFSGAGTFFAPLYLYPESMNRNIGRKPNLNKEIVREIAEKLDSEFTDEKEDRAKTFAPIDILDYMYAILHSPSYREKYEEFLKIDFPRVPYPKDSEMFWQLAEFGRELRLFHLLEHPETDRFVTTYPDIGSNSVEKVRYDSGKVWINEERYFDNVPQIAWEFGIGGYQPARKWLNDRKGRILTLEDISHYRKIIVALTETVRLMKEIDGVFS